MRQPSALIIVDVQNDFCPGGALPVPKGDTVVPVINGISPKFDKVVVTQDWHPEDHVSFAKNHGREPYEVIGLGSTEQVLWPVHCVQGSLGADLHPDLDLRPVDLIIRKGSDPRIDSYSAFLENDRVTETGLHAYLRGLRIEDVYLCGLATDYCVYFSALDARAFGFNTYFLLDVTRGIDVPEGNIRKCLSDMETRGIHIMDCKDL
jgi:nicotinamidase/pyrazinamidase